MIDMSYEELSKVKGNKLMEKLKDEVTKLNNDNDFVKFISDENTVKIKI